VVVLLLVMMIVVLYTVSSGSVTINEDSSVQILAEEACSMDQLDVQVMYLLSPPME